MCMSVWEPKNKMIELCKQMAVNILLQSLAMHVMMADESK